MNLAVSNIAWSPGEDAAAYALIARDGVHLLEVAPMRLWPDQRESDGVSMLLAHGLRVVAFQAIFFGRTDVSLFGPGEGREACEAHARELAHLAAKVGARALVFGAPAVRRVPEGMTAAEADSIAVPFFRRLGEAAANAGVCFCLEPNPPAYGCNYLTNLSETVHIVRGVESPGLRLQLDAGAIALNGEDPARAVAEHIDLIGHVHASQPGLSDFSEPWEGHRVLGAALRSAGYAGVVSIEMKRAASGLAAVHQAIEFVRECYGAA